jgi:hypothetical protein
MQLRPIIRRPWPRTSSTTSRWSERPALFASAKPADMTISDSRCTRPRWRGSCAGVTHLAAELGRIHVLDAAMPGERHDHDETAQR